MLNVLKINGARSSVDNGVPQRGKKGRVEVFVERSGESFNLQCVDVGNYGTERHRVQVPLNLESLKSMIADLSAVAQNRLPVPGCSSSLVTVILDMLELVEFVLNRKMI